MADKPTTNRELLRWAAQRALHDDNRAAYQQSADVAQEVVIRSEDGAQAAEAALLWASLCRMADMSRPAAPGGRQERRSVFGLLLGNRKRSVRVLVAFLAVCAAISFGRPAAGDELTDDQRIVDTCPYDGTCAISPVLQGCFDGSCALRKPVCASPEVLKRHLQIQGYVLSRRPIIFGWKGPLKAGTYEEWSRIDGVTVLISTNRLRRDDQGKPDPLSCVNAAARPIEGTKP